MINDFFPSCSFTTSQLSQLLSKFYNCLFQEKGDNLLENFRFLKRFIANIKRFSNLHSSSTFVTIDRTFSIGSRDLRNIVAELCWLLQLHTDQLTARNSSIFLKFKTTETNNIIIIIGFNYRWQRYKCGDFPFSSLKTTSCHEYINIYMRR